MELHHPRVAVFARRWVGFVFAIWLMIFSGPYVFPNFSTALKDVLGINQTQLNTLSMAKDIGDCCGGVIAGILSHYLSASALLCIGACVCFTGYGIQWLVVSHIINPLPYWAMFIASMVAGNSMSWMNTSVFPVSMRNFPHYRGPVAGLLKGYMGLSAAVFSNFSDNFFDNSSSKYLLMLMTITPFFCLITAAFLRPVPPAENQEEVKAEEWSLFLFNIIACTLATLIMFQDFVPALQQGTAKRAMLALLFVILVAPVVVPLVIFCKMKNDYEALLVITNGTNLSSTDEGSDEPINTVTEEVQADEAFNGLQNVDTKGLQEVQPADMEKDGLRQPLLDENEDSSTDPEAALSQRKLPKWWLRISSSTTELGDDKSTISLFKTWHFYVLYFALLCGPGMGMAFNNNLGQVGQSFGFDTVSIFSSLFSLGNFFGRITSGIVSEYFLRAMSMPRPVWMGSVKLPMIAVFIWLSTGMKASLYAGSLVVGFAQGLLVTLTLPVVSEFYGLKYFGVNFSVVNTHILAGSTIFSSLVAGLLYDQHATSRGSDESICYGSACYGTTFLIYAFSLIIALIMDGLLSLLSKPLYRKLKNINIHVNKIAPKKK